MTVTKAVMVIRIVALFLFTFVSVVGVYALSDVKTHLQPSDVTVIESLNLDAHCKEMSSFEQELNCIHHIQLAQHRTVPDTRCSDNSLSQEPADFIERGHGCCFSRSRLIEKTLTHYGFAVRHLSLHNLSVPVIGYLMPVKDSHSSTEVLTRKGWMYVDSNRPFYLVTHAGEPLDIQRFMQGDYWDLVVTRPAPEKFFKQKPTVFYGLYSRHGGFYEPYLPVPDIDWAQIPHNF